VKPSAPARRRVHYKRDRNPTLPTTAARNPTNNLEKTRGRYIDLLQKEMQKNRQKGETHPTPSPPTEKYGITAATTSPTAALSLHLSKLVTIPDFIPTQYKAYGIPNAIVICIVL